MAPGNPEETGSPQAIIRRLSLFMLVLSGGGVCAAAIYGGWRWAVGFLIGAAGSYYNFRGLASIANSLGTERYAGKAGAFAWILFRFVLLAFVVFVIIKYSQISVNAAFTGLFVSVGAVVLEALFELKYAR